jgi:hypothetical protein
MHLPDAGAIYGGADLLPSWQKSLRSGKSAVLSELTNQALMRLI